MMSKKRKFSFKHGKMSVIELETCSVNPENIYLEVEGREIEVSEDCLTRNSQHFTRVLEDISSNAKSEFLLKDEEEDLINDEEEDNVLSNVSFESVSTIVDFIAKRVSEEEMLTDFRLDCRVVLFEYHRAVVPFFVKQ